MDFKTIVLFVPRVVQSLAGDLTRAVIETVTLGSRPWWWKLRWTGFMLYWPVGPLSISLLEGAGVSRSMAQLSFGETPVSCFLHMLQQIDAGPEDLVVDLGCGRGLHLLAAARELGVRVRGVDLIPGFIARGRVLIRRLDLEDRVEFHLCDIERADLTGATIVYVVSTAFDPEVLDMLKSRLQALPAGTRVITHDWILPEPAFRPLGGRPYPVSWGWAAVNFFEVV